MEREAERFFMGDTPFVRNSSVAFMETTLYYYKVGKIARGPTYFSHLQAQRSFQIMWRFLLCIFVAVLVVGTLYIWFEKSNPVVVYDQVSVSEEIKVNEKEIPSCDASGNIS